MNGIINTKKAKFAGWVLVSAGGPTFFGKIVHRSDDGAVLSLEPAYEWMSQTQLAPDGRVNRRRVVMPLEMLTGLRRVSIRPVVTIGLENASEEDVEILEKCVEGAEMTRKSLIPGGSRIVVPIAGH